MRVVGYENLTLVMYVLQLLHVKSIGHIDDVIEEAPSNGEALSSKTISSPEDNDDK